jgi:uncharacterized phage protein gp47/JayE
VTAYQRPSYNELRTRIEADLAALPAVLSGPLAAALSRADHSQHGYLDWIAKQISPLTCELEMLKDWAVLYSVDRLFATAATGSVIMTGNVGAHVLADTLLRGQNGLDYSVVSACVLAAGGTSVQVRCVTAGADGNVAAGGVLTLIDPVAGVASNATVDALGLTGGAEDEDEDDWRARVADEWQTVTVYGARAGKPADYIYWAKSAHPSVTTALVQLHTLGIGTVVCRPICDGLDSRLPTAAVIEAVQTKIQALAPATADWRVVSPAARLISISIKLLGSADTNANRAAINDALAVAVKQETDVDSVLRLAEIDAAVATVTDQYQRIAPVADIAVAAGEVMVLGPLVWA